MANLQRQKKGLDRTELPIMHLFNVWIYIPAYLRKEIIFSLFLKSHKKCSTFLCFYIMFLMYFFFLFKFHSIWNDQRCWWFFSTAKRAISTNHVKKLHCRNISEFIERLLREENRKKGRKVLAAMFNQCQVIRAVT